MNKTLVIYDSVYGNTEKLAKEIAGALNTESKRIKDTELKEVIEAELVVIGTPTHGGRPSAATQEFLNKLSDLKGKKVAVFDTRFDVTKQRFLLQLLMKTIGYAAPKLAKTLAAKGAKLAIEPEGFMVIGKEGSLQKGELERAVVWANGLV